MNRFSNVKTSKYNQLSIIQGDFKVPVRIIFEKPRNNRDNVHLLGENWYWLHAPTLSTQSKIMNWLYSREESWELDVHCVHPE